MEGFGFRLARVKGSHHILTHPSIPELVNLQSVRGKCKPYQVKQVLDLVEAASRARWRKRVRSVCT